MNLPAPAQLVAEAEAAGLALWWDGDEVNWRAPSDLDPKPWLTALRAHRSEVAEIVRARAERHCYSVADLAEFDRLIDRLADLWRLPPEQRTAMREARWRMAPCRIREELAALRDQVAEAEALRLTLVERRS